jgi:hypothetical protein
MIEEKQKEYFKSQIRNQGPASGITLDQVG